MLFNFFAVLAVIIAFVGSGLLSRVYVEKTFGIPETTLSAPIQEAVQKKKEAPPPVKPTAPTTTKTPSTPVVKNPVQKTAVTVKTVQKNTAAATVAASSSVQVTAMPGPLKTVVNPTQTTSTSLQLTIQGVIDETNVARRDNGGLPPLARNETLDRIARTKLDDMFARQYFEHISPQGIGPSDLAKSAGYGYILIGENLALGNFKDDKDLVLAWMNSPGHRANILNSRYQEIGVAVLEGTYEGRKTWIGVQSFGKPRSSCPFISEEMKAQIDVNGARIPTMRAELDAKKAQIDASSPSDPNYNTYIDAFNVLVPPYNALIESNHLLVEQYNAQVRAFNKCANPPVVATTTPQQ